jgi:secondary thiamine-phosphate synthase enzyme
MKVLWREFSLMTEGKMQLIDLTEKISELLQSANIKDGFVNLMSLHTTTALFLNEWQNALLEDIREFLAKLVDEAASYRHNQPENGECDRQNATAHLRSLLLGQTLCIPIIAGRLLLGEFQRIIFAELDGPRKREVKVQVLGV